VESIDWNDLWLTVRDPVGAAYQGTAGNIVVIVPDSERGQPAEIKSVVLQEQPGKVPSTFVVSIKEAFGPDGAKVPMSPQVQADAELFCAQVRLMKPAGLYYREGNLSGPAEYLHADGIGSPIVGIVYGKGDHFIAQGTDGKIIARVNKVNFGEKPGVVKGAFVLGATEAFGSDGAKVSVSQGVLDAIEMILHRAASGDVRAPGVYYKAGDKYRPAKYLTANDGNTVVGLAYYDRDSRTMTVVDVDGSVVASRKK